VEQTSTYPGARLGLPDDGPGSVASWLARFGALVLDWAASLGVAAVVSGGRNFETGSLDWYTPLVFLLEASLLTALAGGSFGQVVFRLAVTRLDRRPVNLLQALARTALILLVIPPLVFNRDNRGLHDLAVGTVVVRR
jgi:uncharacterized RDD family membrane protein YckC